MSVRNKIKVDAINTCFICTKQARRNNRELSITELLDYLKIYSASALSFPKPPKLLSCAILCKSCSPLVSKFNRMYHEYELIRLKLNACVWDIHTLMNNAKDRSTCLQQIQQELDTFPKQNSVNRQSSGRNNDDLRLKVMQKCSAHIKNVFPIVKLKRTERVDMIKSVTRRKSSSYSTSTPTGKNGFITATKSHSNSVGKANAKKYNEVVLEYNAQLPGSDKPLTDDGGNAETILISSEPVVATYSIKSSPNTTANVKKKFKCTICAQTFQHAQALQFHKVETHLHSIFSSMKNSTTTPKQFETAVHRLFEKCERPTSLHVAKPFACPYCDTRYHKCKTVKYHMVKAHLSKLRLELKKKLQSPELSHSSQSSVGKPPKKRQGGGGFPVCSTCGKKFSTNRTLKVHSRIHTGVTPYKCSYCSIGFEFHTRLQTHVVNYHLTDIFKDYNNKGASVETFERIIAALVVRNVKIEDGMCICSYCSKKFVLKIACKYHLIDKHHQELAANLLGQSHIPFSVTNSKSLSVSTKHTKLTKKRDLSSKKHSLSPMNSALSPRKRGRPPKNKQIFNATSIESSGAIHVASNIANEAFITNAHSGECTNENHIEFTNASPSSYTNIHPVEYSSANHASFTNANPVGFTNANYVDFTNANPAGFTSASSLDFTTPNDVGFTNFIGVNYTDPNPVDLTNVIAADSSNAVVEFSNPTIGSSNSISNPTNVFCSSFLLQLAEIGIDD